jgi:DNA-binding GntR family transcriptional regulator
MPKKLALETLSDKAYLEIRKALMTGRFAPGDALVIRTLADTYGISATPIRDALQRLVAEKSLEALANRTIAVPHLTADRFVELRRIRMALEGLAAELAVANLGAKDVQRLEGLIAEMDDDIAGNDVRSYLAHNKLFHFGLYSRANSPLMLELIENLWARVGPFLNSLFESSHYLPHANEHHRRIVAAVRQHNGLNVRRALVRDIDAAADALMRKLGSASEQPQ